MTPKSLWTIMVKIFGLFLLWQSVVLITQFIATFSYLSNMTRSDSPITTIFITIFFYIVIVVVYVLLMRYCIFKTDWVIEKLHLDRGFIEEKFDLNIHHSTILVIATMVIGGIMLTDGLPQLCYRIFSYTQRSDNYKSFIDNPSSPWLAMDIFKVVLGYLLLTESKMIVGIIERKTKESIEEIEE